MDETDHYNTPPINATITSSPNFTSISIVFQFNSCDSSVTTLYTTHYSHYYVSPFIIFSFYSFLIYILDLKIIFLVSIYSFHLIFYINLNTNLKVK